MEKYGVKSDILYTDLRDEEAQLMTKMSEIMANPTKTAEDISSIERRLQEVRRKLTELDLKQDQS